MTVRPRAPDEGVSVCPCGRKQTKTKMKGHNMELTIPSEVVDEFGRATKSFVFEVLDGVNKGKRFVTDTKGIQFYLGISGVGAIKEEVV